MFRDSYPGSQRSFSEDSYRSEDPDHSHFSKTHLHQSHISDHSSDSQKLKGSSFIINERRPSRNAAHNYNPDTALVFAPGNNITGAAGVRHGLIDLDHIHSY